MQRKSLSSIISFITLNADNYLQFICLHYYYKKLALSAALEIRDFLLPSGISNTSMLIVSLLCISMQGIANSIEWLPTAIAFVIANCVYHGAITCGIGCKQGK